jgi:plasmid stability protein
MMEGNTMTQIVVENLDPTLLAKLTSRSQRHRRSLNEELIAILENAVQGEGVARK